MIYIFWTCSDTTEAKNIIHLLLEQRLIACASFFPVTSLYTWEGVLQESNEVKVILKTQDIHFTSISQLIQEEGSYSVPEIVQVPASRCLPSYLSWVMENTSNK